MKKIILLVIMGLFLASCSQTFQRSEFLEHDSMYKNWDHMRFSWFGGDNPTAEDNQMSIEQGWWGLEVPYVPGQ